MSLRRREPGPALKTGAPETAEINGTNGFKEPNGGSGRGRPIGKLHSRTGSSAETLLRLNERMSKLDKPREHLNNDNAYEDSRRTSPVLEAASPALSAASSDLERDREKEREPSRVKRRITAERRHRFKNITAHHTETILDQVKANPKSRFFGFYTLFWLMFFVIVSRSAVYNYVEFRALLGSNIIQILGDNLIMIGLTDLLMYLVTYFPVLLQLTVKAGLVNWNKVGWLIEVVWETLFLFGFIVFADYMRFPWIGKVFLLLHSLVFIMKQHSFAFYNGYMWGIYNELAEDEKLVAKLKEKNFDNDEQLDRLVEDIKFCREELNMQSTTTPFPRNISFANYFTFTMFPTVVYQIDYSRTERIRWLYVLEKVTAVFGVFFLMIVVAENWLYDIAIRAIALRDVALIEKLKIYPYIFLDLVPPFLVIYLLVFYLIWDAILNALAELTRFADREFYGPWWNSVTWDQFARDWNMPVHRFLLRHVYHSSMSALHVSKPVATIITFFISSCVHELVMLCIFRKLRGYLLFLQMCQLPLVALSHTKFLRNKDTLGNIVFWFGIITGPSLMCSLYLTF